MSEELWAKEGGVARDVAVGGALVLEEKIQNYSEHRKMIREKKISYLCVVSRIQHLSALLAL